METSKRGEAPASKRDFFKPLSYIRMSQYTVFSVLFPVKSGILVRYFMAYTIMLCTNVLPLPYGFSAPTYILVPGQPMWDTQCTNDTGTGFSLCTSVFCFSIKPPMLHPHTSFIYH